MFLSFSPFCTFSVFKKHTDLLQVDVIEFTTAIKNEFSFKVGCKEGFGPWMDKVPLK